VVDGSRMPPTTLSGDRTRPYSEPIAKKATWKGVSPIQRFPKLVIDQKLGTRLDRRHQQVIPRASGRFPARAARKPSCGMFTS
jgi:hypothetical protein